MDLSLFLDQLDELDDPHREELYAENDVELPMEAVRDAVKARRPCSMWLWHRRLAGPPGTSAPLPDKECFSRLFNNTATMLDAYSILFRGGPYPPSKDAEIVLRGCTGAAWREVGGDYLSAWMAVWSALASFAAGDDEPVRSWSQLDDDMPGYEHMAPVAQLLKQPGLAASVYARRATAGHWSGPPAFPELAAPTPGADEISRGEWLRAVEALGNEVLTQWAQDGLRNWDLRVTARLGENPTIQAIREAALVGGTLTADEHTLPHDFESWMIVAVGRREHRAARVGALLAWEHGAIPWEMLLPAVMGDLRVDDLDLVLEVAPAELRAMFSEVKAAVSELPPEIGADLVVLASRLHHDQHMAAARLTTKLDDLEGLPADPVGWLSQTIRWLRELRSKPQEHKAANEQVQSAIRSLMSQLPPFTEISAEQLLTAVGDFPVVAADPMAILGLDDPVEHFIGALLLRQSVGKAEVANRDELVAMISDQASRAIMDLADSRFLELRMELLLEVLEHAQSAVDALRARVSLANTISGMSANSPDGLERATGLFAEAIVDAERIGDPDLVANTVAMWALSLRAHALFQDPDGSLRRLALDRIERALVLRIDDEFRSKLLHAKATVLGHPAAGDDRAAPEATARLIEEAVELASMDRFRVDLERELADLWLQAGHVEKAETCLRRCLDQGRQYLHNAELGLFHAELGRLFSLREQTTEAEQHLRESLRLTSGDTYWGYCGVRLAEFLVQQRRLDEALGLLRRVADAEETMPSTHRWELWRWKMAIEWQVGDRSLAEAAKGRALELVGGTVDEAVVHALWADLDPTSDNSHQTAIAYVRGQLGPASAEADTIIAKLLTHQMAAVEDDTRLELLVWSRDQRQPFLESLLLDAIGDPSAAASRLDQAPEDGDDDELAHRLLKLAMMTHGPVTELRAEIERVRGLVPTLAHLSLSGLCDYAQACRLAADGDLTWLERSFRAWEVASEKAERSARALLPHVAMGTTYAVRNRIHAANLQSDPELAPYVRHLASLVQHLEADHQRGLHELLGMLLLPGPLMHHVLRTATRTLLRATPEHPRVAEFNARLESILASEEQPDVSIWALPADLQARTPFDDQPHPWFITAVAGKASAPPPAEVVSDLEGLFMCCRIRPDRADTVLAAVACTIDEIDPGQVDGFAALALLFIQEAPMGREVWPELYEAANARMVSSSGRDRLLHHLRRARLDLDRQNDATTSTEGWDPQRRFDDAVRHIDLSKTTHGEEAAKHKQEALRKLRALVGDEPGLEGAGFLISLGNAHRLDPAPDLDASIECYERVDQWGSAIGTIELGRLHKVWADALLERGRDGDHQAAWSHAQEALKHRRDGRLRTETLVTAAQIAFSDPQRAPESQARDAGGLLLDATRCSPEGGKPYLGYVLRVLRAWRQRDKEGFDASGAVDELTTRYPGRKKDLEIAGRGITSNPMEAMGQDQELLNEIMALMAHPSGQLFMRHLATIVRMPGLPPGMERSYIGDDVQKLLRLRDQIRNSPPEAVPGALALDAEVAARLARLRAGTSDEVRTATLRARDGIRQAALPRGVATLLLDRMSQIWCPDNVVSDPVIDLDLAVELAEEAVALDGGEEKARRDLVATLARSLRYRAGQQRRDGLARAKRLYERALAHDRSVGNGDSIANTLHLLADIHHYVGDGDQEERLRHVAVLEREAVELSSKGEMRARYQGNLAWTLARLGAQVANPERAAALFEESASLFQSCLDVLSDGAHRANVVQNRETARSMRAQHQGDSAGAIRIGRERLASLRSDAHPEVLAKALHNLADALLASRNERDIREGLDLARQALRYRTPERDPRQHWESAVMVGELLLRLARQRGGLSLAERDEAKSALTSAAATAKDLGAGTELRRAALDLIELALMTSKGERSYDDGEEGWAFLQQAMPYLLTEESAADAEARIAKSMCFALADHEARAGLVGTVPGGAVLGQAATRRVLRWWLRADGVWRRRQRAMLEMPAGLSADRTLQWRRVLATGEQQDVVDTLKKVHEYVPGWLTEDTNLDETRRWLRRNDGLAIGVWPGEQGFLVALVGKQPEDDRVVLLGAPMLPYEEVQLADALRDVEQRDKLLHLVVGWAQEVVVRRLQQIIGPPPKQILWSPHGVLRLVPPAKLFGSVPTSVSASLAMAAPGSSRPRSKRTVVIVANPTEQDMGSSAIEQAAALAEGAGDARLVAAHGDQWGPSVHPKAVQVPADTEHVLEELDHAGLAIIMAHGHMSGPRDAWLHLLRRDGTEERLDVRRLADNPAVLAGLRIILLSCETGRTGDQPHMPGGIAGALLAAGAREVIAPLWSVSVPNALRLGEALVNGPAEGKTLASVLTRFAGKTGTAGTQLGRVSKARRNAGKWDFAAFVSWVG